LKKPPRRPRDDDDDDDDDIDERPRRRRKEPPPQASSALPWIIGGVIVGVVLLLCVPAGILGLYLIGRAQPVLEKAEAFPFDAGNPVEAVINKDNLVKEPALKFALDAKANSTVRDIVFPAQGPGVGVLSWEAGANLKKVFDYYDSKQGKRQARIELPDDGTVINLSPKGTRFLLQHALQVSIWSLPEGQTLAANWKVYDALPKAKGQIIPAFLTYANFIDEDRLLTVGQAGNFELWDVAKKQLLYSIPPAPKRFLVLSVNGFSRSPKDFALSTDRRVLALDNRDGFDFVDTQTGNTLGKTASLAPQGKIGNVWSVSFNNAGTMLACRHSIHTGGQLKEFLTVWEAPTGVKKWQYPIEPNSQLTGPIAWAGANHLILWDGNIFKGSVFNLNDGRFVRILDKAIADRFARSAPDGRIWGACGGQNRNAPAQMTAVDFPEQDLVQRPAPPNNNPDLAPRWNFGPNGITR
jgi:hypothetical protein